MGPERKDVLASKDEIKRLEQENDALLGTTQRLIVELQAFIEAAKGLATRASSCGRGALARKSRTCKGFLTRQDSHPG